MPTQTWPFSSPLSFEYPLDITPPVHWPKDVALVVSNLFRKTNPGDSDTSTQDEFRGRLGSSLLTRSLVAASLSTSRMRW